MYVLSACWGLWLSDFKPYDIQYKPLIQTKRFMSTLRGFTGVSLPVLLVTTDLETVGLGARTRYSCNEYSLACVSE
jgi:hypothetical protein